MFHVYEFVDWISVDVSEISNDDFATPTVRFDCLRREMQHGLDNRYDGNFDANKSNGFDSSVNLKHKISKFSIIFFKSADLVVC